MREEGISITEIAKEIARREGRKIPYSYNGIYLAIKRFNKLLEKEKDAN